MKITQSSEETIKTARKFAKNLQPGDIILLKGELGSGKTTFVKGVCEYFGISHEEVKSPTFTLMNTHSTLENQNQAEQIVHIDTYRMEDKQELLNVGFKDYLNDQNSNILIEWPEKIAELLKNKETKKITFEHKGKTERKLTIE